MTDPDSSRSSAPPEQPAQPGPLDVDIVTEAGEWSAFEPLEETVLAAAREVAADPTIDIGHAAVGLALSDDRRVRELNRAYRGKDKATNVLSFPAPEPIAHADGEPVYLGDIILAAETVAAEAAEQGLPPRHHLQHLVVHGILHLAGFDHETPDEAAEMEALETAILARLGIADPYAEPALEDGDA